ncbi:J domain-containing protein [Paenibacillus sp. NEAU-GSW1]|uniref:J domain-containing protein n=1 Tax=Paenibacillus sp. NEAU-GSW1 TaxID=2682486 RepID=UPI0012E0DAA8|nr:J domain-containing protein [Paenibacillus sp. NEAU-GSW1]MUT66822.1 J domain-containing protein [Paenibacillus sp. NEAU-GSW1]
MNELQQAYQTLGLPDQAPREEVEKRYTTLMRQSRSRRMQQSSGSETVSEGNDFEAVTKAYRYILEYEDKLAAEQFNEQEYGKYKKMAGTAAKADHFWRYYKLHVFGGIVLLALIIYGINAYTDHRAEQARLAKLPPIDLSVMYLGEYFINDGNGGNGTEEQLEAAMLAQLPDWKRFKVKLIYVPQDPKDQMDMASQQKAMVVLATEKPDVYIVDKATFNWIAPQGIFMSLDDLATGKVKEAIDSGVGYKQKTEDDPTEHVYGVEVSESALIGKLPVVAKDNYIIGIRVTSENTDKALKYIEEFLAAK